MGSLRPARGAGGERLARSIPPWHRRQPRPSRDVGPDGRLRDDEPQRPGLHGAVPLRQARRLQGARLLRGGRHRHGALLGPAGDRRGREDRLPAGARVGFTDDRPVGPPRSARSAPSACCSPATRCPARGAGVGPRDRGPARRRARGAHRDPARADRTGAGQPADDDEAARQPVPLRPGPRTPPRCSARSSTGSPATPRRATPSSGGPRRPASERRCASATTRSATSAARPSRAEAAAASPVDADAGGRGLECAALRGCSSVG